MPFRTLILVCLGAATSLSQEPRLNASNATVLLDGKTLAGWVTSGGRYDGTARWTVEKGFLVGRQGKGRSGGLIYTERPYRNFIFSVETNIDWPFDSGVFLRMVPRGGGKGAQVTLDHRPDGEIGGIYADGFLKHNPGGAGRYRKDRWNRVTVRCVGADMHITAWLNGTEIMDYRLPPGTSGYAPTGLIGLQVHGGAHVPDTQRARFRNVFVRELPDFDGVVFTVDDKGKLALTDKGRKMGWRSLFKGSNFKGWEPLPSSSGYRARNGILSLMKDGGGSFIRTRDDYRNFELRLDYKTAFMANSGIFLRADRRGGNPAFSGCEIQILDDLNWERVTRTKLDPWQFTGSLYGSVPAGKTRLRPLGHWNSCHFSYKGPQLAVRLNGDLLYDVDTTKVRVPDGQKPFAQRAASGFIGMQSHAPEQVKDPVYAEFRNIFIRPLPD